jgi:hypothetical protein
VLEDDDEVAITHLGADRQFRATSVAMVNIRATLAAAAAAGVIGEATARLLTDLAKEQFFPDRSYPRLLELGAGRVPAEELAAFGAYWPEHALDVKHADAVEMLGAMNLCLEERWPPPQADFLFESTNAWESAKLRATQLAGKAPRRTTRKSARS